MTIAAFEQIAHLRRHASDAEPDAASFEIGGPPFEGTDAGEPQFVGVRKIDDDKPYRRWQVPFGILEKRLYCRVVNTTRNLEHDNRRVLTAIYRYEAIVLERQCAHPRCARPRQVNEKAKTSANEDGPFER